MRYRYAYHRCNNGKDGRVDMAIIAYSHILVRRSG